MPFDGYGRAGNHARAASALRDAGLLDAFEHHHLAGHGDLDLPAGDSARGPTSLINERALLAMTRALNERVGAAVGAGRLPIVYGGDCSMLLGIVTGLRDHVGDVGLVFIDGHEDTMPLDVSEDGEAANTELGLLLGLTGRTLGGDIGDRLPALRRDRLVVLGPRDDAWRRRLFEQRAPQTVDERLYPDPTEFSETQLLLRQYACPGCAAMLAQEFCLAEDEPWHDFVLTLGRASGQDCEDVGSASVLAAEVNRR